MSTDDILCNVSAKKNRTSQLLSTQTKVGILSTVDFGRFNQLLKRFCRNWNKNKFVCFKIAINILCKD